MASFVLISPVLVTVRRPGPTAVLLGNGSDEAGWNVCSYLGT